MKKSSSWVELQAQTLREKLSLSSIDVVDPFELAKKMDIGVFTPYDFPGLPINTDQLLHLDSSGWSAGALPLPNGKIIVIMNPVHAITRKRASLMEELAHIYLKHPPSKLTDLTTIHAFRNYNKDCEDEAYYVGAATLLPRSVMLHAKLNKISKTMLAKQFVVSEKLVFFRENMTQVKLD